MAWHPLSWEPAFFSEIEKFPSAVLAHHYSNVPNLGDMTKYKDWPDHAIDLLVGGTPCQSFSIAGLRQGLADPRGNLMLTYLAIARRYQPRWLVWENVPGVLSSNGGRDFAALVGGLEECGYHAAWRVLDAQYVRVDGFGRAVPQRRRRVFVVGYLGDWRRAAAVLFEREGMSGNSAPRREAGQGTADPTALSVAIRGREGTPQAELGEDVANAILTPNGGRAGVGAVLTAFGGNNCAGPIDAAASLAAHGGPAGRMDFASETFIAFNSREDPETTWDRTGPLGSSSPQAQAVAYSIMPQNSGKDYKARKVDVAQPIMAGGPVGGNQGGDYLVQPVAYGLSTQQEPKWADGLSPTLTIPSKSGGGQPTAVAFAQNSRDEVRLQDGDGQIVGALAAEPGMKQTTYVSTGWAVRRLTPTECERLQGFPDGYTAIPYRSKPAADGPRYKALGNSMAVNAMRWIGQRIQKVEELTSAMARAA